MAKKKKKSTRKAKISEGLRQIRDTPSLSAMIARRIGITRQAVSDWDKVPLGRLLEVEQITGIPREKLRPELFRRR